MKVFLELDGAEYSVPVRFRVPAGASLGEFASGVRTRLQLPENETLTFLVDGGSAVLRDIQDIEDGDQIIVVTDHGSDRGPTDDGVCAIAEAVVAEDAYFHIGRDADLSPPFQRPPAAPPTRVAVPSWRLVYVGQTDVVAAKCLQRAWRCFSARGALAARRRAAREEALAAASFSFWNGYLVGVLALLVIAIVLALRPSSELGALPPSSPDATISLRQRASQPPPSRSAAAPTPRSQQHCSHCSDDESCATEARGDVRDPPAPARSRAGGDGAGAARPPRASSPGARGQSALPNAANTQRAGTTTAREKRQRSEIPSASPTAAGSGGRSGGPTSAATTATTAHTQRRSKPPSEAPVEKLSTPKMGDDSEQLGLEGDIRRGFGRRRRRASNAGGR